MRSGAVRWLTFTAMVLAALVAAKVLSRFNAASIQDDAYMFTRYADNILLTGVPSFNPGGEAAFGLTSPAFLAVVLPIRAVLPRDPAWTMLCSSALCGLVFVWLLTVLVGRSFDGANPPLGHIVGAVVLISAVLAMNDISAHFLSGMDTMATLAFLTGYILVFMRHQRSLTVSSAWLTGCLGGLAFSVRPDLLIYTVTVPAAVLLAHPDRRSRLRAAVILIITASVAGLQILLYSKYLHSPFPLAFYAKSIGFYGGHLQEQYRLEAAKQLYRYITSYPFLFSAIGMALLMDARGWWRGLSAVGKGLLPATAVFIGYHLFFVVPIMGYSQRFLYPTLPAIVFLAGRGMVFIVGRTALSDVLRHGFRDRVNSRAVLGVTVLFLLFSLGPPVARDVYTSLTAGTYRGFDVTEEYRARWTAYWFRLDEFSRLPDDLVIATTEVGHPLAMNPGKTILDLTGLNDTGIAHDGFRSDSFFRCHQPDLIYLPHPDYREMIQQICGDPFFIGHYDVFSSTDLSSTMALALYRDSDYYRQMLQIVSDNTPRCI